MAVELLFLYLVKKPNDNAGTKFYPCYAVNQFPFGSNYCWVGYPTISCDSSSGLSAVIGINKCNSPSYGYDLSVYEKGIYFGTLNLKFDTGNYLITFGKDKSSCLEVFQRC